MSHSRVRFPGSANSRPGRNDPPQRDLSFVPELDFPRAVTALDQESAFRPSPVHAIQTEIMIIAGEGSSVVKDRWPGAARVALIVGGSLALWAIIIAVAMMIF